MATIITGLTDDDILTTGRVAEGAPRLAADPDAADSPDSTDSTDSTDQADAADEADVDGTDAGDGDTTDA